MLRTIQDEPWFVILELEEAYYDTARALGYRDVDGGFGSPARAFLHSRVEWVGGVSPLADESFLSDQGPFAASHLEVVQWHGYEIRVPPLPLQLESSKQRGLAERVQVIERALS